MGTHRSAFGRRVFPSLLLLPIGLLAACGDSGTEPEPEAAPTIGLSRTSLSFTAFREGDNPADQTLAISNSGGGTLIWSCSDDADWLTVSPPGGTSATTMSVSVDISGLSVGSYSGTITVTATGASNTPQTVSVTLAVTALTFDGEWGGETSQGKEVSFTVTNNGIPTITLGFRVPSCGASGTLTTTFSSSLAISNGSFSFSATGYPISYSFSGTFSSDTTASGNVSFTYFSAYPYCSGSASATWSATKQ